MGKKSASSKEVIHRAGALKQVNKKHKHGNHASKRQSMAKNVSKKCSPFDKHHSKPAILQNAKKMRKLRAKQLRQKNSAKVCDQREAFGKKMGPPILVTIVADSEQFCANFFSILRKYALGGTNIADSKDGVDEEDMTSTEGCSTSFTFFAPKYKSRITFTHVKICDIFGLLDVAKASNAVLFIFPTIKSSVEYEEGQVISQAMQKAMSCLKLHALPTVYFGIQGIQIKDAKENKNFYQKFLNHQFPSKDENRLFSLDRIEDVENLMRSLASQINLPVSWMNHRPTLVANSFNYAPSAQDSNFGVLKVDGYLRNSCFDVNKLVHLPGIGDFQLNAIKLNIDPCPFISSRRKNNGMDSSETLKEIFFDPTLRETLQREPVYDPWVREETWPRKEDYQTCGDYETINSTEKDDPCYMQIENDENVSKDFLEDDVTDLNVDIDDERCEEFEIESNLDANSSLSLTEEEMKKRKAELREQEVFPDEVDTPFDVPAQSRFAKYRGLKNFTTTLWNPKENLPDHYARLFSFKNFKQTRKAVLEESEKLNRNNEEYSFFEIGSYISLHIENFPKEYFLSYTQSSQPLVVFGLFRHEQKLSVLNSVLHYSRSSLPTVGSNPVLKSKDSVIVQCGPRRFITSMIYSEHSNNLAASHNKAKLIKFFEEQSQACVGSFIAPVTFTPVPVQIFSLFPENKNQLLATGHLLNIDPDRIILKRCVLSGHPFKIVNKAAVVRYMFFRRKDIEWFKPVQLITKYGRKGHIRSPLGTHGYMKCIFNAPIKSMDVVLMKLYKRVFPKMNFKEYIPISSPPS